MGIRHLMGSGAALAALVTLSPAHAQTSTSNTMSTTSVTVPVYNVPNGIGSGNSVPADANGYSPYNTHAQIDENVTRQVPAISAPTVYGLNPCSIGASLGVSTPIVGISGAVSTTDDDCEARNNAALAISAFHNEFLAREATCAIRAFRLAWKRIGKPCIEDQPVVAAITNPIGTAPAPLPVPVAPAIVPLPIPTPLASVARPDWCDTASPVERRSNPRIRLACGA